MFGKPIRLFRIFGFEVGIDVSWFILFLLVTGSLALGLFPFQFPGLSLSTYVSMGVLGSLGLFFSIVFHELSHSLVARRFGLHMHGITLFLFGGVAEMPEEPRRPGEEFWMAAAGPASSLGLAAILFAVHSLGQSLGWSGIGNGLVGYLALVNLVLAIFNLVPAFPLDGGRVLRSAFWAKTGDFAKATRIAAAAGEGFGVLLFVFGAARILAGNPVGGVWWMLIGLFIRTGARAAATQLTLTRLLKGVKVRAFTERHPIVVPPELPLRSLLDDYLYRYNYRLFPVGEDGNLRGCIGAEQVKTLRPGDWDTLRVRDAMAECPSGAYIDADDLAESALKRMQRDGQPTLLVMDQGRIAGVVNSGDILHFLATRADLEKASSRGRGAGNPLPA